MLLIATVLFVGFGRVFSQDWASAWHGNIPEHAFSGETRDENSNLLFICRGWVESTVACGKTSSSLGNCRIPFHFREHTLSDDYDVLTEPPGAEYTLEWTDETYSDGVVPPNAVSAAYGVYVGRYMKGSYYLLGKVVPRRHNFFYGDNGNEKYKTSGYEVLIMKPRQVDHYKLHDVVYDLSQASQTISPDNVILDRKNVQNKGFVNTTTSLLMEFTQYNTSKWSEMNSFRIHTHLKMTVSAGIPGISETSTGWNIGRFSTRSYTYRNSHTTSETIVRKVIVHLPADSNVTVWMIAKEANVNVPYRASVTKVFTDGSIYTQGNVPGVYTNAHLTSFETDIDSVPLGSEANKTFWSKVLFITIQLTLLTLMFSPK